MNEPLAQLLDSLVNGQIYDLEQPRKSHRYGLSGGSGWVEALAIRVHAGAPLGGSMHRIMEGPYFDSEGFVDAAG